MPGNGQWFEENDPEGVAFEYDVIEMKATSVAAFSLIRSGDLVEGNLQLCSSLLAIPF